MIWKDGTFYTGDFNDDMIHVKKYDLFYFFNFSVLNFCHCLRITMRDTPTVNFINVFHTRFSYKFFAKAKT